MPSIRGTIKASPAFQVSPLESFGRSIYHSLITSNVADFESLFASSEEGKTVAINRMAQAQERLPTTGGVSEFLGQTIGGILPTAAAVIGSIAFPPAAPALLTGTLAYYGARGAGAGRRSVTMYERETGKEVSPAGEIAVAAGYTLATVVFERMGIKGIREIVSKLGPSAFKAIAKTYVKGNAKETAAIMVKEATKVMGGSALIEGLEEGAEELATNAIDMFYDERGRSMEGLMEDVPRSVLAGALGGAMLGGMGGTMQGKKSLGNIIEDEQFKLNFKNSARKAAPDITEEQLDMTMILMEGNAAYQGKRLQEYIVEEIGDIDVEERAFSEYVGKGLKGLMRPHKDPITGVTTNKILLRDTSQTSILAHELAHVFHHNLKPEQQAVADKWVEAKPGQEWNRAQSEKFARSFEKWLRDGKIKNPVMEDVLLNYRRWMQKIYEKVKGSPVDYKLSGEVKEMFEIITGGSGQVNPDTQVEWMTKMKDISERYTEGVVNTFAVQNQWDKLVEQVLGRKVGRSKTGIAIKGMFGVQKLHGERGYEFLRVIGKVGRKSARDLGISQHEAMRLIEHDLPLVYETPSILNKYDNQRRSFLAPLSKALGAYFDSYKGEYEVALEDETFGHIEGMRARLQEELSQTDAEGQREKYEAVLREMERLKDARFVHIPYMIWFEKMLKDDPVRGLKILKVMEAQKRRTFKIQNLLDIQPSILTKEDIRLTDITDSYSRRAGKDLSLLNIINAAKEEGLAKPYKKSKGYDKNFRPAPTTAPVLKGYQIHQTLADWIADTTRHSNRLGVFARGLNIAKMAAFANPLFLPMYDLIQATMLGTTLSIKSPGYFIKAAKDYYKFSKDWQEANHSGLTSTPYNNPLGSHKAMINSALKSGGEWALHLKGLFTPQILKHAYNLSWKAAWTLDNIVRMASYNYLRDKGFSRIEAAQKAALYHGDYAGVPANTRRTLNKIFFTPTFKIAMGKLYGTMIKDAGKMIMHPGQKNADVRQNAFALARTFAIVGAWHGLMLALGFEDDEFGRRYFKKVGTPEGPKELVLTWSGPHNMFLKYIYRARTALGPEKKNPMLTFFVSNKWEVHPLWRTLAGIVQNERQTGERIYNTSDSPYHKSLKATGYFTTEIVSMVRYAAQLAAGEELGMKQDREVLASEIGKGFDMLARPFTFSYTRQPKEQRIARQAKMLLSDLKAEISRAALEGKVIDQDNVDRMIRRIQAILES